MLEKDQLSPLIFILLHHDLRDPGFDLGLKKTIVNKRKEKKGRGRGLGRKSTRKHKLNKTVEHVRCGLK